MKRIFLITAIVFSMHSLYGQVRGAHAQLFFLDADYKTGVLAQNYTAIPLATNYPNALNVAEGQLKYTNGRSQAYDLQLGYYFNKKRNLALSAGYLYVTQSGNLGVDVFHVEYQSSDDKGAVFRQLVTADNGIHEAIQAINIGIPVLLKYRLDLSERFFCSIDGGVVFNIQSQNYYTADASFDYEAIYKINGTGANLTYIYDNATVPDGGDWLITKSEFIKDNPKGNMQDYFNSLKNIGYNVGLNESITNKTGNVKYAGKSIGYLLQPAINFRLTDNVILKLGGYYLSQSFKNTEKQSKLTLTNQVGTYTSLLNYTTDVQSVSYGITLGISFYFNSYVHDNYDNHYYN